MARMPCAHEHASSQSTWCTRRSTMRNGTPFLLLPATPEYATDMCTYRAVVLAILYGGGAGARATSRGRGKSYCLFPHSEMFNKSFSCGKSFHSKSFLAATLVATLELWPLIGGRGNLFRHAWQSNNQWEGRLTTVVYTVVWRNPVV